MVGEEWLDWEKNQGEPYRTWYSSSEIENTARGVASGVEGLTALYNLHTIYLLSHNTPRPSRGTRIESCNFIVLIGDPWFFLFVLLCLASRVEWERWTLSISFVWHVACDVWPSGALFFRGFFFCSNYRVCVDFSGSFYLFLIFFTMCTLSG